MPPAPPRQRERRDGMADSLALGQNVPKSPEGPVLEPPGLFLMDGIAGLPKMDALKKQRRELADKKKALYAEYRQAQRDMREAVAVKANIDHLLGLTDGRDDKEQTR